MNVPGITPFNIRNHVVQFIRPQTVSQFKLVHAAFQLVSRGVIIDEKHIDKAVNRHIPILDLLRCAVGAV